MALYKFTFSRTSMVEELFTVEATTEELALERIMDGDYDSISDPEWIDWAGDTFELVDTKELDPLYSMIKEHSMNEDKSHG